MWRDGETSADVSTNHCTVYVYPFCRHLQICSMCSSWHILQCIDQTNIQQPLTTWIPTASSLILPLKKDIIHGWLSSRMLEGVSPVLGANGPHAVYSVSRFGLVVSRASKNHHASYQDQTIEEKGILGVPLSWRGLKRYHPNFRGPFWVQNQWQSTFFAGKPCSCVSWSFNSSCLPQRREWEISLFRKRQCSPQPLWMDGWPSPTYYCLPTFGCS